MELIYIKDLSKAYGKTRVLDHLSVRTDILFGIEYRSYTFCKEKT